MKTKKVSLGQIRLNEANPRTITEGKFQKLINSLLALPKMLDIRPIVVDRTLTALGGNMRFRALSAIADMDETELKSRILNAPDVRKKSDDEQLALLNYWIAWHDAPKVDVIDASDLTNAEQQEFIIKDNASFGEWDYDALANNWDASDLSNWGVDSWNPDEALGDGQDNPDAEEENAYTQKIEKIVYEPSGPKPPLTELVDKTYTTKLLDRIDAAAIPEDIKDFLRCAAYRHNRFDYEKIANYYAQSDKAVQELMEDSALVIIDFDKAVELGFVRLTENFDNEFRKTYGENVPEDEESES